jgi:hypothetical protein
MLQYLNEAVAKFYLIMCCCCFVVMFTFGLCLVLCIDYQIHVPTRCLLLAYSMVSFMSVLLLAFYHVLTLLLYPVYC